MHFYVNNVLRKILRFNALSRNDESLPHHQGA